MAAVEAVLTQLEALAAESEALLDRAIAMARANGATPALAIVQPVPWAFGATRDARGATDTGIDVACSGERDQSVPGHTAETTTLPDGESPSPAAGVEDVVTGGLAEPSTVPRSLTSGPRSQPKGSHNGGMLTPRRDGRLW